MAKNSSRLWRVPEDQVEEIKEISDVLDLPSTEAQRVRDKFFKGDFNGEKRKTRDGKEKVFLEMEL